MLIVIIKANVFILVGLDVFIGQSLHKIVPKSMKNIVYIVYVVFM